MSPNSGRQRSQRNEERTRALAASAIVCALSAAEKPQPVDMPFSDEEESQTVDMPLSDTGEPKSAKTASDSADSISSSEPHRYPQRPLSKRKSGPGA